MPRYEFTDDQSNKFWEISQSGAELHIAWGAQSGLPVGKEPTEGTRSAAEMGPVSSAKGAMGTAGRTQTKTFADAGKASTAMAKLSAEKLGKGYALAGGRRTFTKTICNDSVLR